MSDSSLSKTKEKMDMDDDRVLAAWFTLPPVDRVTKTNEKQPPVIDFALSHPPPLEAPPPLTAPPPLPTSTSSKDEGVTEKGFFTSASAIKRNNSAPARPAPLTPAQRKPINASPGQTSVLSPPSSSTSSSTTFHPRPLPDPTLYRQKEAMLRASADNHAIFTPSSASSSPPNTSDNMFFGTPISSFSTISLSKRNSNNGLLGNSVMVATASTASSPSSSPRCSTYSSSSSSSSPSSSYTSPHLLQGMDFDSLVSMISNSSTLTAPISITPSLSRSNSGTSAQSSSSPTQKGVQLRKSVSDIPLGAPFRVTIFQLVVPQQQPAAVPLSNAAMGAAAKTSVNNMPSLRLMIDSHLPKAWKLVGRQSANDALYCVKSTDAQKKAKPNAVQLSSSSSCSTFLSAGLAREELEKEVEQDWIVLLEEKWHTLGAKFSCSGKHAVLLVCSVNSLLANENEENVISGDDSTLTKEVDVARKIVEIFDECEEETLFPYVVLTGGRALKPAQRKALATRLFSLGYAPHRLHWQGLSQDSDKAFVSCLANMWKTLYNCRQ